MVGGWGPAAWRGSGGVFLVGSWFDTLWVARGGGVAGVAGTALLEGGLYIGTFLSVPMT